MFIPFYFILFLLLNTILFSQDNLIELQQEIQRIEKEISKEQKFHDQEKEQHKGFNTQKEIKTKNILQQINLIKNEIDSLQVENKQLIRKINSFVNQINSLKTKTNSTLDSLKSTIQIWSNILKISFPHNRKKYTLQFKNLYDDLKEEKVSISQSLDQFYLIVLDLISQGYSVENFYGSYTNSKGKTFDGVYFRTGNIFYFFMSEDQKQISYLTRINQKFQWNDKPNSNIKREIIKTFNISQGKTPPKLVLLPIQIEGEK